ncbi:MAG: phosphatidate cytidylyltransferase [Bacteroidota bacterium]
MNNFWQRAITGVVFVAAIVGLTLYNEYSFLILLGFIGMGSLYEYYKIVFKGKIGLIQILYILLGVGLISSKYWINMNFAIFGMALLSSLTAIGILLSKERTWKHIGYLIFGLLYVSLPLTLFYNFSFQQESTVKSSQIIYHSGLALNLFILIWCSDTFAYLCGRAFGKHKLFESVSPKKTWEGFIGGGILTIGFSFLLAYCFNISFSLNATIALSTVVIGSLGDLVQSMLKREFDVKDSGTILPGHGGVLDRFDALLISLPFTTFCYFLAYYF